MYPLSFLELRHRWRLGSRLCGSDHVDRQGKCRVLTFLIREVLAAIVVLHFHPRAVPHGLPLSMSGRNHWLDTRIDHAARLARERSTARLPSAAKEGVWFTNSLSLFLF